jgi:hypothetical protein
MHRNNPRNSVRRGILALAVVTSLAVAGAQPAAARELSLMEHLQRLWSTVAGSGTGAWSQLTGWLGGNPPAKATSTPTSNSTEKGWGMDPNGNTVTTSPTSDPLGLQ